jgi:hypothetical protein
MQEKKRTKNYFKLLVPSYFTNSMYFEYLTYKISSQTEGNNTQKAGNERIWIFST